MAKIFVTRHIPERGLALLRSEGHEVTVSQKKGVLTKEELISELGKTSYEAVLCLLTDTIDKDVFNATPEVKIFANYAVGFDNIDVDEAKKRGIIISNTPDVLSETVAEYTLTLLLALAHRLVEADTFTRQGNYTGWAPELLLGSDVYGKTLGIVGVGRIGSRVARSAKFGFDMDVLYYDVEQNKELEKETGATFCSTVEELLPQADYISLHVPLLKTTHHLLNKERIALMKKGSYLVNTSRGAVINEKELVAALSRGDIKGAALDVFEDEPRLAEGLSELTNVIITPHLASATKETREKMSERAAKNILAVLSGVKAPDALH